MKVPGKKNNVTSVITLMDTVSSLVFTAIRCIASVIASSFFAECWDLVAKSLFASMLWWFRSPESYAMSVNVLVEQSAFWAISRRNNLQGFYDSLTTVGVYLHSTAGSPNHLRRLLLVFQSRRFGSYNPTWTLLDRQLIPGWSGSASWESSRS